VSRSIAVDVDEVAAAGHSVLTEAGVVERLAQSTATEASGCPLVDAALDAFALRWGTQLAALGAVSASLAVTLAGAANEYSSTDRAIGAGYR
jgi:hypothetical protein